ncbi:MAG: 3-dehydroquinate synthase [Bacteroidota bacterium]
MPKSVSFRIGDQRVRFFPNERLHSISKIVGLRRTILITDQQVYRKHKQAFLPFDTIVLRAGESYKVQATIDSLVERLINLQADRSTFLIGVGGGVVTDLVGYLASVYMRGVDVGFVPTTLLSMVDASIGGKNGVDVGKHKNLVGTIRQPNFILHDHELLSTLPTREWSNGFAEIIKHASIGDPTMFRELSRNELSSYRNDPVRLQRLIARNVRFKFKVVQQDAFEKNLRKQLNFGHTLGHALEMHYELSHGEAISLGMMFAAFVSEKKKAFEQTSQLRSTLSRYHLPVAANFSADKVFRSLSMDKKRTNRSIDFILLKRIGQAEICPTSLNEILKLLRHYL